MKLKGRGPKGDEPEKLATEPKLDPYTKAVARLAGRCSNDLVGHRQLGFGAAGNIPAKAIDWWCRREGLDEIAARVLATVIRCMDEDQNERDAAERRRKKK